MGLLADKIKASGKPWEVVNASISGETTAGGLGRLDGLLARHKPGLLILELGANDGLRGLPLAQMRANLAKIVRASQMAKCRVLLVGMRLPPNYGDAYNRAFEKVYVELARQYKTALLPYLFEGFGEKFELFQPDRIHPKAQAHPRMLANVWPVLQPLLR